MDRLFVSAKTAAQIYDVSDESIYRVASRIPDCERRIGRSRRFNIQVLDNHFSKAVSNTGCSSVVNAIVSYDSDRL